MARFRGMVSGGRSEATRLGHAGSGLLVEAQGWQGKCCVKLYDKGGVDWCEVWLDQHHGHGAKGHVIYNGPVSGGTDALVGPARLASDMMGEAK